MNKSSRMDLTLQQNLERLSNLMAQKKDQNQTCKDQNKTINSTKKIFVNLQGFIKPTQSQQLRQSPILCKTENGPTQTITTQTQTPKTPSYRQVLIRPQSMAIMEQFKAKKLVTLQDNKNINQITPTKSNYKNWIGLSVIERNKKFLQKKELKLQKLREEQTDQELSKCTFSPHFYNQIKSERPSSCFQNKSYVQLHQFRKNDKLLLY